MASEGPNSIWDEYHRWYYEQEIWTKTTFMGVRCLKSVSDMWNYHEILKQLDCSLVVEFGTYEGGCALYLAEMLKLVSARYRVLTIDISHHLVHSSVRQHKAIELLESNTTSPQVAEHILALRSSYTGKAFFLVDSDHKMDHVFAEMLLLREVTNTGDYVVVEDGNINGHPVLPGWGPGPYEALARYREQFPNDYLRDIEREQKFGFTFAPHGFMIRR